MRVLLLGGTGAMGVNLASCLAGGRRDMLSSYICLQIRIAMESSVERLLVNDTVLRFRRSITAQNRIGALSCITKDDCKIIEEYMTKYSFSEHASPLDQVIPLATYADLKEDIERLQEWMKGFSDKQARCLADYVE